MEVVEITHYIFVALFTETILDRIIDLIQFDRIIIEIEARLSKILMNLMILIYIRTVLYQKENRSLKHFKRMYEKRDKIRREVEWQEQER